MLICKPSRRMIKNRTICLLNLLVLAAPLDAIAAEPDWWVKQKQQCGLSSGLAYNTWVSQGSPCNKSGSDSSAGGSIGTIIGTEIGKGLGKALFGDPEADARRRAQEQQLAEEQRRAAEEAERKLEDQKNRLLGGMIGVDDSPVLGLMGVETDSGLKLMTDDQPASSPSWDRYKDWEKYKRDVLAYQELLTKNNAKNKENHDWCKGHIPLSTSPNRANWEARCNPNGQVKSADNRTSPVPEKGSAAKPFGAPAPPVNAPPTAMARPVEPTKTATQGGLGLNDLMLGETAVAPKAAVTVPVGNGPVAVNSERKEPATTLAGNAETVKAAAQSGFDTKGPLNGTQNVAPKAPQTLPVAATSPATDAAAAANRVPTPAKHTPKVERPVITAKQAVPIPTPEKESTAPSQKAVVEKQLQALNCAINGLQGLARGMDSEGTSLRAELNSILDEIRGSLNRPCSGQGETQKVQTYSLSGLAKGAKNKEDHLEGSILVTRDERSCEVHLDVQYASSLKSASSSRSSGISSNEQQSIIHLDKTGNIIVAESPAAVGKCLAGLPVKKP